MSKIPIRKERNIKINENINKNKIKTYFFHFGRNPHLSFAELLFYLKDNKIPFRIKEYIKPILILGIEGNFDPIYSASRLSSIIKVGIISAFRKISDTVFTNNSLLNDNMNNTQTINGNIRQKTNVNNKSRNQFNDELSSELGNESLVSKYPLKLIEDVFGKIIPDSDLVSYSLNLYGFKDDYYEVYNFFSEMLKLHLKKYSEKVTSKHSKPSSLVRQLNKAGFLDIVIVKSKLEDSYYYICKTLGAFDIKTSKVKYEKRPFVDETIGTSVRIARLLVNLSGVKQGDILLDPFCGLGTILQEGLLNGCDVIGVDIVANRVKQCKENLKWATKKFNIKNQFKVFQGNAKQLLRKFKSNSVNAIVTEPELGPFLKKMPNNKEARKIISKLISIYSPFFKGASEILKNYGRIVIVLPKIRTSKQKFGLPISSFLKGTRLKLYNPLNSLKPTIIEKNLKIPLLYKERWHKIERGIYVFEKM
ncbi:MAG: TRM11 family SAM-dependent methyltransferase [Promethearchaeota archaeon]